MEWDDWQTRADAGRAKGGQHLRHPSIAGLQLVKDEIDDALYSKCPECGGTAIRQYEDPANRGMTLKYKLCLAAGCEYRFDVELAP